MPPATAELGYHRSSPSTCGMKGSPSWGLHVMMPKRSGIMTVHGFGKYKCYNLMHFHATCTIIYANQHFFLLHDSKRITFGGVNLWSKKTLLLLEMKPLLPAIVPINERKTNIDSLFCPYISHA